MQKDQQNEPEIKEFFPEIPGYRIEKRIGSGAMGTVYKAFQLSLDRYVAMKIISSQFRDPDECRRFINEARFTARLSHPHIITVFDTGQHEHYFYLSMELLENGTLDDVIKERGKLDWDIACRYILQLAEALNYANVSANLVHRDVKPANILFRSPDHCVLTDFGIAKDLSSSSMQTSIHLFLGTPCYASPEQVKGLPLTFLSDMYSLGAMFVQLTTGKPPFNQGSAEEIMIDNAVTDVPALPEPFTGLQPVINKWIAKKPEDRIQSVDELAKALASFTPDYRGAGGQSSIETLDETVVRSMPELRAESMRRHAGSSSLETRVVTSPEAVSSGASAATSSAAPASSNKGMRNSLTVAVVILLCIGGVYAWLEFEKISMTQEIDESQLVDSVDESTQTDVDQPLIENNETDSLEDHGEDGLAAPTTIPQSGLLDNNQESPEIEVQVDNTQDVIVIEEAPAPVNTPVLIEMDEPVDPINPVVIESKPEPIKPKVDLDLAKAKALFKEVQVLMNQQQWLRPKYQNVVYKLREIERLKPGFNGLKSALIKAEQGVQADIREQIANGQIVSANKQLKDAMTRLPEAQQTWRVLKLDIDVANREITKRKNIERTEDKLTQSLLNFDFSQSATDLNNATQFYLKLVEYQADSEVIRQYQDQIWMNYERKIQADIEIKDWLSSEALLQQAESLDLSVRLANLTKQWEEAKQAASTASKKSRAKKKEEAPKDALRTIRF